MILRLFSTVVRLLRNLNDKLTSLSLLLLAAKNDLMSVHFNIDSNINCDEKRMNFCASFTSFEFMNLVDIF